MDFLAPDPIIEQSYELALDQFLDVQPNGDFLVSTRSVEDTIQKLKWKRFTKSMRFILSTRRNSYGSSVCAYADDFHLGCRSFFLLCQRSDSYI